MTKFTGPQSLINYFYEEVINRQRLEVIDEIVDPDFILFRGKAPAGRV